MVRTNKYCPKCKETKKVVEFYKCGSRYDGIRAYCKICTSFINKTQLIDRLRVRYKEDEKYREKVKSRSADFGRNNKDMVNAHNKVYWKVKSGKLIRKPCRVCGEVKVEAHHPDYTKPLMVVWLCGTHHKLANLGKLVF